MDEIETLRRRVAELEAENKEVTAGFDKLSVFMMACVYQFGKRIEGDRSYKLEIDRRCVLLTERDRLTCIQSADGLVEQMIVMRD